MKIRKIIILAVLLISKSIFAQEVIPASDSIKQSMATFERLNVMCRGGLGDDPNTEIACKKREVISKGLQNAGWCYIGGWVHCMPKHQVQNSTADIVPPIRPLFTLEEGQHLQKQRCFLLSGMMSSVPMWRDNGVPISRSYNNVAKALLEIGAPSKDWEKWHKAVISIYSNPHITSNQVESKLRPQCKRMPGSMY